jgi:hypothetical protein
MKKFRIFTVYAVLALCALLTPTLFGQNGGATLTGVVTDPTGAVIPEAKATLTELTSGTRRTSISNGQGTVSFIGVPASTYMLDVSAAG